MAPNPCYNGFMEREGPDRPWVIGHDSAVKWLQSMVASGRVSQAYLLAGPARVGKTTLALYFARLLQCTSISTKPCGQCSACRRIERGVYPDVRLLGGSGRSIGIGEIRALQIDIALAPFESAQRVCIICDFHLATLEAANCLLKTLEEPPASTILVLTADHSEQLLPTIVSRCQVLNLQPLPAQLVSQALQQYWHADPGKADLLAHISQGRIGWAIEAAVSDRDKYLLLLEQSLHQGILERLDLARALAQVPDELPIVLQHWETWWRDLLHVKVGIGRPLLNMDRQDSIRYESRAVRLDQTVEALKSLQDCAQQLDNNVNPQLALEAMLLQLPTTAGPEA